MGLRVFSTVFATQELLGFLAREKTSQFDKFSEVEHRFSDPVFLSKDLRTQSLTCEEQSALFSIGRKSFVF